MHQAHRASMTKTRVLLSTIKPQPKCQHGLFTNQQAAPRWLLLLSLCLSPAVFADPAWNTTLQEIKQAHQSAIASGELPKSFPLIITDIHPGNTAEALETLVSGGSKLPNQSWQTLVKGSEDYFLWVDVLFDPVDTDTWLKTGSGSAQRPLTAVEKQTYLEQLAKSKQKWKNVSADWQLEIKRGELNEKVYEETDALFAAGRNTIIHPSRETFRRLLVASASIAHHNNYVGNQYRSRKNLVSNTAIQAGEYAILTNPKFSGTKIEFGNEIYSVKYILPDTQTISSNPSLKGLENISAEAILAFKTNFKYNIQTARLKEDSARLKEDSARLKEETAQIEERIAQSKERIAQDEEYIKVATQLDGLTHEILGLISVYLKTREKSTYNQIQEKMSAVNAHLPRIHENAQNVNEKNKSSWVKEIGYIRNLQAKVDQLPRGSTK